jgi:hypothetical protein
MKTTTVMRLRLKGAKTVDKNAEYARGFVKKCTDRDVDPAKILEIANTLELHL